MKNKYYKKFISNRYPYYQSKFKPYRNKLNHLIKLSKISYYNKYFDSNKSNIKNIWKGIKQLISLKPLSSKLPTKIINNDIELVDAKDIANAFNNFFANVGPNIASTIPADHSNISPEMYLSEWQTNSCSLSPITSKEISEEICQLNVTKARAPFNIPTKFLKLLYGFVSKPLEKIFNLSFSTGTVPNQFKVARVIPIFKKVSQICLENYRPISLLSIFNRLL